MRLVNRRLTLNPRVTFWIGNSARNRLFRPHRFNVNTAHVELAAFDKKTLSTNRELVTLNRLLGQIAAEPGTSNRATT